MNQIRVKLNSGRVIDLAEYYQTQTYACLLEGQPREKINERIIQKITERARKEIFGQEVPVFLLEPEVKHVPENQSEFFSKNLGPIAVMPETLCVGLFNSTKPARDTRQDLSFLAFIWFQHAADLIIEPSVVEKMKVVNWERLAKDGCY